MKDPARPHVDPHHADPAHPHVHTPAADPAMKKTALFVIVGSVVAIGAVVVLMKSAVHEVSVRNAGDVDVRVEYAWKANGDRVTRDRQVAPGGSISFGFEPDSEVVVYHPVPDDKASWVVIPVGEKGEAEAPKIARELRRQGFHIELGYAGNVGRRMKRANKINARVAVILGEDELARHTAMLKDLDTGTQTEVPLSELAQRLAPFR